MAIDLSKGTRQSVGDWLSMHESPEYISASQAATVLGVNPYETAFGLYQKKIGALPWPERNITMRRGHVLEGLVAELYEEQTGNKIVDPGEYTTWAHAGYIWLFATPDRFPEDDRKIVELKTASPYFMAQWRDGVPHHYWVQVQIQLQCCDMTHADVACLVGDTFIMHEITRDDGWFDQVMPELIAFRQRCIDRDPPPIEPEWDKQVIHALHPDDNGETVAAPEMEELFYELGHYKELEKDADRGIERIETQLKERMGDNTFLEAGKFTATWRTAERRGYTVKASKSRKFTVKEARP